MKVGVWNVKLGWLYVPKNLANVGNVKIKIGENVYDGRIDARGRLFCKALKSVLRGGMEANVKKDGEYYIVELQEVEQVPTVEVSEAVTEQEVKETPKIDQTAEVPTAEVEIKVEQPTDVKTEEESQTVKAEIEQTTPTVQEIQESPTVVMIPQQEAIKTVEIERKPYEEKWERYKAENGFNENSIILHRSSYGFRRVSEEEVLKLLEKGEYIKSFIIENPPLPRVFLREEKRLFDLFRLLNEFDDEEVFKVEYDGLTVKTMDPSHVMLIVASIPSVDLKEFEASRDFDFAVRIDEVCKSFNPRKNDEVKLEAEKYGKVKITVGNITKTFSQLAIDPDEIPQLKIFFDGYFRMNVNELYRIIKSFGDSNVTIIIDGGNVKFEAKNSDGEVIEAKLEDEYLIDVDGSAKSTYDARRLADVLKHLKNLTLTIKVSIANNKPIMIETLEGYPITIYIAPYVE